MRLMTLLLGCLALAFPPVAFSQGDPSYPTKAIHMFVPYPPGGGTDGAARAIAQRMSSQLGQPIVVENKPGSGTLVAAESVAKAPADGYTVLWATSTTLGISPAMYHPSPIDPFRDFVPVAMGTRATFLLVRHPSLPVESLAELIEYAKKRPSELNYGSAGSGSPHHLFMEILQAKTGMRLVHVPYKGSGPATLDLIAGRLAVMINDYAPSLPHIRAGKLKVIALASARPSAMFPGVPAIGETVPGFDAVAWQGLLAPAGTPGPIVAKLADAASLVVRSAEYAELIKRFGMEPFPLGPAEFKRFLATDVPAWAAIVKSSGARPN